MGRVFNTSFFDCSGTFPAGIGCWIDAMIRLGSIWYREDFPEYPGRYLTRWHHDNLVPDSLMLFLRVVIPVGEMLLMPVESEF